MYISKTTSWRSGIVSSPTGAGIGTETQASSSEDWGVKIHWAFAIPFLISLGFANQSCVSKTQIAARSQSVPDAAETSTTSMETPSIRFTKDIADEENEQSVPQQAVNSGVPGDTARHYVPSLSGRPDYTVYGFNPGMSLATQPDASFSLFLFPLANPQSIPSHPISGRPDYTLYGLKPVMRGDAKTWFGVKLRQHNILFP